MPTRFMAKYSIPFYGKYWYLFIREIFTEELKMILKHDKTEYIFSDEHSENDAILIGYFSAGLDNAIKKY